MVDVWSAKAAIKKYDADIMTLEENIIGLQETSRKIKADLRMPYYEAIKEERKKLEEARNKKRMLEKMIEEYYKREGMRA